MLPRTTQPALQPRMHEHKRPRQGSAAAAQVMAVGGLTRENIASHLQKYRRLLEKKAGLPAGGAVTSEAWPLLEAAQRAHLVQARPCLSALSCFRRCLRCCVMQPVGAACATAPARGFASVSTSSF